MTAAGKMGPLRHGMFHLSDRLPTFGILKFDYNVNSGLTAFTCMASFPHPGWRELYYVVVLLVVSSFHRSHVMFFSKLVICMIIWMQL